jgi:hypothetical protein
MRLLHGYANAGIRKKQAKKNGAMPEVAPGTEDPSSNLPQGVGCYLFIVFI